MALANEGDLLGQMLKEANQHIQQAEKELDENRQHISSHRTEQLSLRSQLVELRAQSANSMTDCGHLRKGLASREGELRE
jgi:chromosome segregation ATPase